MPNSLYLSRLKDHELAELRTRLYEAQSHVCFICSEPIDLELHSGSLDFDHIEPTAVGGKDDEINLALTHATCNRSKGAADLRVAKCLAELKALEADAKKRGERGVDLGDLLAVHGGAQFPLRLKFGESNVSFSFTKTGDHNIQNSPIYQDKLSGLNYFFALVPKEYLHHDNDINPRSIGSNIRGLIEEFLKKRPQLHVGLAWWRTGADGAGTLKLFDGQHKAAAQILLGVTKLPIRVFVDPPKDLLVQANTNAGSTLRQVAFDKAVMRHLGSTLYGDRTKQYQQMHDLPEDDYSFSEQDLVVHFRGERRQMLRFILDAQRHEIARDRSNRLLEFVEWAGRGTDRPMAYSTVERAFFQLLYQKALTSPIDQGLERALERGQLIRLMNTFADVFFVGKWDVDLGGRRLENRIQKGEKFPPEHLRAWRIARDEVAVNVMRWVRLVIENHYAVHGVPVERERLFLEEFPETLWQSIERFLSRLASLKCWVSPQLSSSVFGPKQNQDYWESVFRTGNSPTDTVILEKGLDLLKMIAAD
ncbi:MAG: HNH endonuclease signature motif containing protein [Chloroflexota bacterium]|nr:HNH endonuclease signature motif containing protein [Chloroflexota bacterium]